MIIKDLSVPVIAIDGGAATGKGTVRALVGAALGFHQLDSGAVYRVVGYECVRLGMMDTPMFWDDIASTIDISFKGEQVFLRGQDVTEYIRSEEIGKAASKVSQESAVREELMEFQLSMRKHPGLVADGRDQGLIFETPFRFFLTASPEVKAQRRVSQLIARGVVADYSTVLADIITRDEEDTKRKVKPLRPHPEARIIHTDYLSAQAVAEQIIEVFRLGV